MDAVVRIAFAFVWWALLVGLALYLCARIEKWLLGNPSLFSGVGAALLAFVAWHWTVGPIADLIR